MFSERVAQSTDFAERLANIELLLVKLSHQVTSIVEHGMTSGSNKQLNAQQAAEYLNIALPTLYSKVQQGEINYSRPGGKQLYFMREDLDQWVEKSRRKTKAEIQAEARKGGRGK